jgi:hypothetical protein
MQSNTVVHLVLLEEISNLYLGAHKSQVLGHPATKFCMMVPNICGY